MSMLTLLEQVQGLWKVKNQNMSDLCEEVKELKEKFVSFEISHVLRVRKVESVFSSVDTSFHLPYSILTFLCLSPKDKNSEADAQANLAVRLSGEAFK